MSEDQVGELGDISEVAWIDTWHQTPMASLLPSLRTKESLELSHNLSEGETPRLSFGHP